MTITEETQHWIRDHIETAISTAFRQGPDPATRRNIANSCTAEIVEHLEGEGDGAGTQEPEGDQGSDQAPS